MEKRVLFSKRNILIILSAILLLGLYYYECFVDVDKDIDAFIGASKLILQGKTCYDVWIPAGGSFLLYFYSPLFAVLLTPLSFLPQQLVNVIWLTANLWLLYRIVFLLDFFLNISRFNKRNRNIYYLILAICMLRYLMYNFDLGQMTIFLVYASLESVRLIQQKKVWIGAALLALAINIKLLPLTILLFLIYRAAFKASVLTIVFFAFFLLLPAIFIGFDFNMNLHIDWWNMMTKTVDKSAIDDLGRPGLMDLILPTLMETDAHIQLKRNLFSLNIETALFILYTIKGLLVVLTLYFLQSRPFKRVYDLKTNFYALAYILLVTPLIFPHQGKYSYFYLLPAYAYLINEIYPYVINKENNNFKKATVKQKVAVIGVIASFALLTLTTDGLIGRHYSNIADHYHAITLGALILIIPLAILGPEKNPGMEKKIGT